MIDASVGDFTSILIVTTSQTIYYNKCEKLDSSSPTKFSDLRAFEVRKMDINQLSICCKTYFFGIKSSISLNLILIQLFIIERSIN